LRKLLRPLKRPLAALAISLIPRLLKLPGVMNRETFKTWEKAGYHITPVHFYQPIPDTRELAKAYPKPSALSGIEWNEDGQRELLRVFDAFAGETATFAQKPSSPESFYLDNGLFVGIDPHIYYSVIRHFKPRKIIEVGAGFSTLVAAQALKANGSGQVIAVEPYPRNFIERGVNGIQHIAQKAEALGAAFFDQLEANDILFIDSSHVVKTSGDVNYLVLDVLPRLKSGVIVHIHDIFLPFDYPEEWTLQNHWFWTEQYLVQAFLIHNARVEILLANNFLAEAYYDDLKRLFPHALKWTGGSLWLRIK
jgi:hypothetical protein